MPACRRLCLHGCAPTDPLHYWQYHRRHWPCCALMRRACARRAVLLMPSSDMRRQEPRRLPAGDPWGLGTGGRAGFAVRQRQGEARQWLRLAMGGGGGGGPGRGQPPPCHARHSAINCSSLFVLCDVSQGPMRLRPTHKTLEGPNPRLRLVCLGPLSPHTHALELPPVITDRLCGSRPPILPCRTCRRASPARTTTKRRYRRRPHAAVALRPLAACSLHLP
jgi:hypothetical protein